MLKKLTEYFIKLHRRKNEAKRIKAFRKRLDNYRQKTSKQACLYRRAQKLLAENPEH